MPSIQPRELSPGEIAEAERLSHAEAARQARTPQPKQLPPTSQRALTARKSGWSNYSLIPGKYSYETQAEYTKQINRMRSEDF